jgi:3-hydroxymyristoyl/3-hydroxydecanoyl-(acyl carrier protein) dehydratase
LATASARPRPRSRRAASFVDVTRSATGVAGRVRPQRARALCAGHFPDDPLLPGAALVALMAELAAVLAGGPAAPVAVERAVFRHRVSPGEALAVAARRDGRRVHATVTSAGRIAAWASLRFAPRP